MRTDRYNRAFSPRDTLSLPDLEILADDWQDEADQRALSPGTKTNRAYVLERLLWFLRERKAAACGTGELRAFLGYLNTAHASEAGRWGSGRRRPLRPVSAKFFHSYLASFFNFAVREERLDVSPMARLNPPVARPNQIRPFTPEEFHRLLEIARVSKHPTRDAAILLFLVDTGARASEACGIEAGQVDLVAKSVRVFGKGNKARTLYFGRETRRALWRYLKEEPRDPHEPLFRSERGRGPLTRSGLLRLVRVLGRRAGLDKVRCSPHTLRHTAAVEFIKAGGAGFALKELLGHTTLAQTQAYCNLAQADIAAEHARCSPADRLKRR